MAPPPGQPSDDTAAVIGFGSLILIVLPKDIGAKLDAACAAAVAGSVAATP